jgi:chromosome segregation ATPase
MTVLGKILVFVNLIFSLLTAGLIVMVYSTRTNWASAFNKEKATVAIVRAQADAEFDANKKVLDAKEAQVQTVQREKQQLDQQLATARKDLNDAKVEVESYRSAQSTSSQASQAQADELKRRQDEVTRLTALVSEREQKIADIDRQMARLRDESVSYRIQYESAKARNADLLKQIQEKDQELTNLRLQFGPGRPTTPGQQRTPVPEDFKGTIRSIQGDLATITPGSDAGAAVGAELHVFRLAPRPEYLGRIVIQAVTPHEAVGRLEGASKGRVRVNDEVAARLR